MINQAAQHTTYKQTFRGEQNLHCRREEAKHYNNNNNNKKCKYKHSSLVIMRQTDVDVDIITDLEYDIGTI